MQVALLLAILVANYECTLRHSLSILNKDSRTNDPARIKALDSIVAVNGLTDNRLLNYYRRSIELYDMNIAGITVIIEICTERYFNDKIFMLLFERERKTAVLGDLQFMYRVRSHWWGNPSIRTKLQASAALYGENAILKKSIDCKKERLPQWTSLCRMYAYMGETTIEPLCKDALTDKRTFANLHDLAKIPPDVPCVARPCDEALISLLLLNQADVEAVFQEYGFRQLSEQNFQKRYSEMIDKMISDYSYIKKNYFPAEQLNRK